MAGKAEFFMIPNIQYYHTVSYWPPLLTHKKNNVKVAKRIKTRQLAWQGALLSKGCNNGERTETQRRIKVSL